MNNIICPLCVNNTNINHDFNLLLENLIYKYLKITINHEHAINVCSNCEQTLVNFDEFAQKCWSVQSSLQENRNIDTNVKFEADGEIEIKIENPEIFYEDLQECTDAYFFNKDLLKTEDPLLNIETSSQKAKRTSSRFQNSIQKGLSVNSDVKTEGLLGDLPKNPKTKGSNDKRVPKKRYVRKNPSTKIIIKYICHICDVEYPKWSPLEAHCLNEHSTKPKVLCVCGTFLSHARTAQDHMKKHDEAKSYKCEHCDKSFCLLSSFEVHMARHMPKEEFTFTCSLCPKKFINQLSLKCHLLVHQRKKYSCDICGKLLISKYALQIHKKAVHENIRDQICDECGHTCSTKGGLVQHKKTHSDNKEHICNICSKTFKTKIGLTLHNESIHLGLRVKCPDCSLILKNRKTLVTHRQIHTNDELKFACTLCEKRFRRKSKLKIHMNSHDGLRPYVCQWCSAAYSNNQNLKNHKRREHPQKFQEEYKKEIELNIPEVEESAH